MQLFTAISRCAVQFGALHKHFTHNSTDVLANPSNNVCAFIFVDFMAY